MLIGAGIGCFESAIVSVVGLLVSTSLVDDAVTMVVIAQVMGNVGALSATGSLFQNLVARNVARLVPTWSAADVAALTTGTSSAVYARLDAPLREEVVVQVLAAIRAVFLVPTAACAAGLILAVFMSVGFFLYRVLPVGGQFLLSGLQSNVQSVSQSVLTPIEQKTIRII